MMIKKKLRNLIALIGIGLVAKIVPALGKDSKASERIYESRYHTPFPLQKGGEKIDVLVRVEETNRVHGLYLIFVLQQNWPEEKKEELYRFYKGFIDWREPHKPYPAKIHLQIDSADLKNNVHIDRMVTERSLKFSRDVDKGAETWYANALFMEWLPAGVYRIRLENMAAVPEIDFATLVAFEKDNRKY